MASHVSEDAYKVGTTYRDTELDNTPTINDGKAKSSDPGVVRHVIISYLKSSLATPKLGHVLEE